MLNFDGLDEHDITIKLTEQGSHSRRVLFAIDLPDGRMFLATADYAVVYLADGCCEQGQFETLCDPTIYVKDGKSYVE